MNKLYLGIDAGRLYTKGVIIDEYNNIISSGYIKTSSNQIESTKQLLKELKDSINLNNYQIVSVGVTGASRRLLGALLNTSIIKNEVNAIANGTINLYKEAKTIIELGGYNSKIIYLKDKMIVDYKIYNDYKSFFGAALNNITNKLNIKENKINDLIIKSQNTIDFKEQCSFLIEEDAMNKIQHCYLKEDILAGLSHYIAKSFTNNLLTQIKGPIVLTGGISKNQIVRKDLEKYFDEKIIVNHNSHLISAYGMALFARACPREKIFNYDIDSLEINTKIKSCNNCDKECLIVSIYRNNKLIDYWGNRCNNNSQ